MNQLKKIHYFAVFAITIFCCFAVLKKAVCQKIYFQNWDMESGLSQNSIFAITQDAQGFLWLGTNDGLNRFDGKEFKIFRHDRQSPVSISNNSVSALLTDNENRLWVGTSAGLNVFDFERQQFRRILLTNNDSNTIIHCIYQSPDKTVWIATSQGLFRLINRKSLQFEKFGIYGKSGIPHLRIQTVFQDTENHLWVGTNWGLARITFTPKGEIYKTFLNEPDNPFSINSNIITSIAEDTNNNLWIGTQNKGINLFHKETETFTHIDTRTPELKIINDYVRVIKPDAAGNIWIGTQEGLSMLNLNTQKVVNYQNAPTEKNCLSQNSVHSLYIDRNGLVWVGTFFGGINLGTSLITPFSTLSATGNADGLSNNVVSSIAADGKGNLWIGTEGGGLNYFDADRKTVSWYQYGGGIGSNLIKRIIKDSDGNVWIGTHAGGLNLYRNGKFITYFLDTNDPGFLRSEISTIAEDSEKQLWVGIQGGIRRLNIYKRTGIELQDISQNYDRQILEKKDIKIIYPDSKHHVWIGTSKGIFIIYRNKKTVEPVHAFASDPALQNDYITCVEEDAQEQIWIGLENGGVKKFDPRSKKITTYSTQNGLPANKVLGILTDKKGWLWISTGNGLAALNPTNESFRIFTKVDGLPSNSFNYNAFFKDEQGMLYFGTYKGMVCFDPENIYNNTTDAPIVFTSLKLLKETTGIDISHTKNLKLTYTQNVFTIEFALLNYIKPKKNRYAYMLKGFDDTWTETNTPAVTYMNLKPGHYTLSIKGRNNDGHWSSTTELSIVILPPFWRTWWAYLSYLILTATILFFITRFFYLRELIKKEEALHQNKLNFFTNVTHEIRTHLALIMSPVEKMITDRTSDTYLQTQLQSIQRNADSLLNLSEELMDFRKADTGNVQLRIGFYDIVKFVQEIYESFRQMALSRNIQTSFTHNIPAFELYFDKEQLEKIFFNLISNAFKFTPDGGKINVAISEENDTIKIAVSDNGRGISAAHKDKLFNNFFQVNDHASQNKGYGIGLALANKIAQLHGARIEVDSCMNEENGGERKTTFTVLFPKQPADFTKTDTQFSSATTIEKDTQDEIFFQPKETPPNRIDDYIDEKKLTVLVVDDNHEIRENIRDILAERYHVVICENAVLGWDFASEKIPDIIISDIMMPEIDGLTFCNQLKSDLRTCHIPVILLTALTTQQNQIDGLQKGADIYMLKPFNRKILELNVRNLLATREHVRESVQHFVQEKLFLPENAQHSKIHSVSDLDSDFLQEVIKIIDTNIDDPSFHVPALSKQIGMSIPVLNKKIKAVSNLPAGEFIKSMKLQKAAELLRENKLAVYEVCYAVGFQDRKYFSKEFKKKYGQSPKEYSMSCRNTM